MRRGGAAGVLFWCIVTSYGMSQAHEVIRLDQTADQREVVLRPQQMLEITLPENPTTGFRWEVRTTGMPACADRGSSFDAPSGGPGSGGARRFRFEAVQIGVCELVLVYRRSWEDRPPARTFTLTVRVEP